VQVSQPPNRGTVRRVHDRVDRFTADDVHRGLVRYDHHDDDEDPDVDQDRFAFVVCVQQRCADGAVEVRVSAVSPPTRKDRVLSPAVVSRPIVVGRTLGSVALTRHHLNTSCAECRPPFDVVYSVTAPPRHGRLARRAENETVASFSQRDLDLGRVVYRHVDSAHSSDSVQLSASVRSRDDDVVWSSSADVRLEIVMKPSGSVVLLTVVGNVSVVEGERTFITENQLSVQHGDDVDDAEIVVVRLPVYGRIQVISERKLRTSTSFLLSEVIIKFSLI